MPTEPLTEEQQEIRELIRELARERIAPRAAEIDKSAEFPWDVVELYREHELFALLQEERYGGTGTGMLVFGISNAAPMVSVRVRDTSLNPARRARIS